MQNNEQRLKELLSEYNIYELVNHTTDEEMQNIKFKQALNKIRKYCEDNAIEVNTKEYGNLVVTNTDDILQIINEAIGDDDSEKD